MKPIAFSCAESLRFPPEAIAQRILNVANWSDFAGYGVLPGVRSAELEVQTKEVVGTRIKVLNTDGSRHVEEIVAWQPDRGLTLRLAEFSPPVSRLATHFDETWQFERVGNGTKVVRSFQLYPKSALTWPVLWMISILLKKAIARHLLQLSDEARDEHGVEERVS